jgi:hypothetical protein
MKGVIVIQVTPFFLSEVFANLGVWRPIEN